MDSLVKHAPNTYYLELRQDYVLLCQSLTYKKSEKSRSSPHCKALILAVMERWTNDKVSKKKEPYIYMTYPQWVEEMYEMFARWTIIDSLDELVAENLITRESYRINGRESYKYLLNVPELNRKLAELPHLKRDATGGKRDASHLNLDATSLERDGASRSTESQMRRLIESDTQIHNINSEKESSSSRASQFTDEQYRVDALFCQIVEDLPKITEKLKGYWTKLAPHIHTLEDMQSLYAYAERHIEGEDTTVYPGNLANSKILKGWLKERAGAINPIREAQAEAEATVPVVIDRSDAELPRFETIKLTEIIKDCGEMHCKAEHVAQLQKIYQRYTGSDEGFYQALIDAEGEIEGETGYERMLCFFVRLRTRLGMEVEAVVPELI